MRIVSLSPTATEIICLLGLEDQLVGVTHACDYPAYVRSLPKVTSSAVPVGATHSERSQDSGTPCASEPPCFALDTEAIRRLSPDMIVTQELDETSFVADSEIEKACAELSQRPQMFTLDPATPVDLFHAIQDLGAVTGRDREARVAVHGLDIRFTAVTSKISEAKRRERVILLEGLRPLQCASYWNPELIYRTGGEDGFGYPGRPSRPLTWGEIAEWDPEVLIVACAGTSIEQVRNEAPLLADQPGWNELSCVKAGRVFLVDGVSFFHRPGPRLIESLEILAALIHPELCELPEELKGAVEPFPGLMTSADEDDPEE